MDAKDNRIMLRYLAWAGLRGTVRGGGGTVNEARLRQLMQDLNVAR